MLIKGNNTVRNVFGISEMQEAKIYTFLQGAVYCWCKNFNDEEFALRDLMGGENFDWEGTPLYALWEKHNELGAANPVKSAGIDAGWILKKVILEDKRKFELRESEMTNKYRWIK
ncbi:hypothetical protein [Treponema pectinovorum]|uniref:hypothetical protein n=1 Tax=Treponema pectinovorum TaxID=164 RepID=UPI0011F29FEF|nr:hypothetical protein [Treponema pectinovorum]